MPFSPVTFTDGVTPLNKTTFDALQAGVIAAERTENKGVASGYASLDSGGKVPLAQTPLYPVTDGQWVKGSGGVPVWAAITPADVQGGVAMQKLFDTTLGANGILDWNSIPQTYTHLRIELTIRSVLAGTLDTPQMRCNAVSAAGSYFSAFSNINDAAPSTIVQMDGTATAVNIGVCTAATGTSGYSGAMVIEIPNYTTGSWTKAFTAQSYALANSGASNSLARSGGGVYTGQVAITRIQIGGAAMGNLLANSRGVLYGIS